jgi:murein DD-endopeptidase MepM/ murein hydrolase activator NlpD
MQFMITNDSLARTRVLRVARWQLALAALGLLLVLLAVSGTVYHLVFLKAAREGWPVVGHLVGLVVRDEFEQRDRFMRDNLDVMAQKVGELQAKLVRLEAMGERVARMVNLRPEEFKPLQRPPAAASAAVTGAWGRDAEAWSAAGTPAAPLPGAAAPAETGAKPAAPGSWGPWARMPGAGGPYVPEGTPSLKHLQSRMVALDEAADFNTDLYTLFESRLLESRLTTLTIPSAMPLDSAYTSGFGFRADPFTGRQALHTGLDFPAEPGAIIRAAAGGIVVTREYHPSYGEMLEIDHGNDVITRYAHCSSIDVPIGALVKRGQAIAKVGNTGRSTGPHLHFEVLVKGVHHDPVRFLAGAAKAPQLEFAARPALRR